MSASATDVVVTGLGAITSLGVGMDALFSGLLGQQRGIRPLRGVSLPDEVPIAFAGQIPDYDPLDHFSARRVQRLDRFAQFSLIAASEALAQAGISAQHLAGSDRVGVYTGTAVGGFSEAEAEHRDFLKDGYATLSPTLVARCFGGAAHSQIAQEFGIHGPGATNWNSCAASNCALGDALHAIRRGEIDIAIAGGIEAPLTPLILSGFHKLKTLSVTSELEFAMNAFDETRSGFVMAEGGAMLVLESRQSAESRGARILARFRGFGLSHEGHHPTSPDPEALWISKALERAKVSAGLESRAIDLLCAHGSATVKSDPNEVRAVEQEMRAFPGAFPYITAHKSNIGHSLGAGGAIEAAITVRGLDEQRFPPMLLPTKSISAKGARFVSREPLHEAVEIAANVSLGFGGIDSISLFSKEA